MGVAELLRDLGVTATDSVSEKHRGWLNLTGESKNLILYGDLKLEQLRTLLRECVICYEHVETGKEFPCSNPKCTEANTTCCKCGKAHFLELQRKGKVPNCHMCRQPYPEDHLRKHGLVPLPAPETFSRVIDGIKYSFYPPGHGPSEFGKDNATFVNGESVGRVTRPNLQRLPLNEAEIRIEDHDEDHYRVTVIPFGTTFDIRYHFDILKDDAAIDLLLQWQKYLASHKE